MIIDNELYNLLTDASPVLMTFLSFVLGGFWGKVLYLVYNSFGG